MSSTEADFYRHWHRLLIEELAHSQESDNKKGKIWRKGVHERFVSATLNMIVVSGLVAMVIEKRRGAVLAT